VSEARADLAAALIRPGQFTTTGDRLVFYAREMAGGELRGVMISDATDPNYPTDILARSAAFITVEGRPTLLLRDAVSQQLDDNQQLSVLEFDQYMLDLSEFARGDSELLLKASDKYLHELLFIDMKNYFESKDAPALLAEAHTRLTSPLQNIVMVLIAILAVLGGDFNRQGYSRRIAIASAAAVTFLVVQIALQSAAVTNPAMLGLLWAVPFVIIVILGWVYFHRGRHIGRRSGPLATANPGPLSRPA
jgi:lipopolysaccharide export system permease protein